MKNVPLTFREKLGKNQTVEKSALLTVGITIIPVGLALVEKGVTLSGIILVVLGILCIVSRELLKLK